MFKEKKQWLIAGVGGLACIGVIVVMVFSLMKNNESPKEVITNSTTEVVQESSTSITEPSTTKESSSQTSSSSKEEEQKGLSLIEEFGKLYGNITNDNLLISYEKLQNICSPSVLKEVIPTTAYDACKKLSADEFNKSQYRQVERKFESEDVFVNEKHQEYLIFLVVQEEGVDKKTRYELLLHLDKNNTIDRFEVKNVALV